MTAEIVLTRGYVALVDDEDLDRINQYKWYASQGGGGRKFYAVQATSKRRLRMHRLVLNAPDGMEVDHINGDTLDNRKENLRLCNRHQNARNTRRSDMPFKGICFQNKKWYARIVAAGKKRHLGCFHTATEAAQAYDRAARDYFGEFARLNFPNG